MKKKKLYAVLALVMMVDSLSARDFRFGGLKYNVISEDRLECEVTFNGKEYLDEPYTADSVKVGEYAVCDSTTYKVTRIGENAF